MKKIKFLIASMLGAIALVFACVLGTRVNAATEAGEYDLIALLGETYTPSTTNLTNIADHSIFKNFVSSKKIQYLNASTEYTGEVDVTGKNAVQLRENTSGFDIVLDLSTGQTASLTLSTYGKKDKGLHVGDNSTIVMTGYDGLITKTYDLGTGTTHVYGTGYVSLLEFVVTVSGSSSSEPITSDEETADCSYTDGYRIDIANLSSESTTLTAAELLNFYVPYGSNSTGSVFKYINNNVVNSLQTSGSAYGLKFTTTKASVLDIQVGSTSKSNVSIFRVTNVTTSAVLTANENSTLTTNTAANVAGVYEVTGQNGVAMTYNLPAGEYFMEFISGTSNADTSINRGGRWFKLGLNFVEPVELSAKLQKQVTTDKTAIRFIATLEGFNSRLIGHIESMTYTIKVTGYKAFTKNINTVYTSVKSGETTICAAKDNTYYCSYLFTNLLTENNNKSLVGKNISAYLTVKLSDGTTIKTNSVGYTIVAA